jgi:membrane fusion protein, multidrug efflux system
MQNDMRPALVASLACLITLATLSGCGKKPEAQGVQRSAQTVTVQVVPTKLLTVQRTIEIVGTLYGDEEATISSKVAGRVSKTLVDIGDRVEAGQALAQLDPADYELGRNQSEMTLLQTLAKLGLSTMPSADFDIAATPTVQQAHLQAANAQARYGRAEKLFQQQPPLISEQDYADAKTNYQVAQSTYDVALLSARSTLAEARTRQADLKLQEQRLADTTVRAPLSQTADGKKQQYAIAARLVSSGEYLKDGVAMFRVVADNPIRFRASVPERYLGEVKLNQPVTVSVDAYRDAFTGTLTRINPQVEAASRSFQVEINVDNAKGLLRPGGFAHGAIATRNDASVLFVPQESVVSFAGIRKVFTVVDGKAVEHEVALGASQGSYVEITSGLKDAGNVVVSGASKLAAGTPVQLKPTSQPAAAER